ncbi:uncharacterized protein C14orf119-like [Ornithodoros turicata]
MPSNKGPPCRTHDQMDYLVTWFREYSELQRDDFLKVLVEKYAPNSPDDYLADTLNHIGVSDRAPSIFQCRMKLFDEWFQNWSDEEKAGFLDRLRHEDADFVARYDRVASAEPGEPVVPAADVEDAGPLSATVVIVNGNVGEEEEEVRYVENDEKLEKEEEAVAEEQASVE